MARYVEIAVVKEHSSPSLSRVLFNHCAILDTNVALNRVYATPISSSTVSSNLLRR
jgi:hypothetical protein